VSKVRSRVNSAEADGLLIMKVSLLMLSLLIMQLISSPLLAKESGRSGLTKIDGVAPEFELLDFEGETHHLSDYRGEPLIVNFWATWCPPCRAEMPSMQRAWEKIREEGIAMLAINVGENEDMIFPFTAEYPVEFPLLMDLDSKVTQQWKVRGLPTTIVVDPAGRMVYRAVGGREWDSDKILDLVRALK
jgi:peroxiredoxin